MTSLDNFLANAYKKVGAYEAEILYIYSDFRTLGSYINDFASRDDFGRAFVQDFLEKGRTIIFTTFSYTTAGIFDVFKTPTRLGVMNKWILSQPGVVRSEHPLFSYAALGPSANLLLNIGKSAFGYDSIFTRLRCRKTAFLHIGRPVWMGNTAIHHIEHVGGATYRFHKAFKTKVFRGEKFIGTDYTAFLRRRDVPSKDFAFTFRTAASLLFAKGLVRQVGSEENLTNISLLLYDETIEVLHKLFETDQNIFIQSSFKGY